MKSFSSSFKLALTLVALTFTPLLAVDSQPLRVVSVDSALCIGIEVPVGGLLATFQVQLTGIRLLGPHKYAVEKLKELCPPGSYVMLSVKGLALNQDSSGRIMAWVLRDFPAASILSPGSAGSTNLEIIRSSLQVEMVKAGWAVPDNTQDVAPVDMLATQEGPLRAAFEDAKERKMGAYSLPEFSTTAEKPILVIPDQNPEFAPKPSTVIPLPETGNGF